MSWFKTQLSRISTWLQDVTYPSGSVGSSYEVQYPVLMPLKILYEKISENRNRLETYRLLREVDPELYGAIDRISKMVRESYGGFAVKVGEEVSPKEKELLDELEIFEEDYSIKEHFYAISTALLTYGDSVYLTKTEPSVGVNEFRPLPMEYLTAFGNLSQLGDYLSQVYEANYYLLNEGTDRASALFSAEDIHQFSLNRIGSTVPDLLGRYTFGVWSQSPIEALRGILLWKISLRINDMLLRNHLVPRQHHKLDLTGFVPQNFPGDTLEDRYAAAKAAAKTHIDLYKSTVATPLKEVDKAVITGNDVDISYLEPRTVSYVDPNPLINEINKSIWASIAPIEAAVTAQGARSYAAELVISSYSQLIAGTIADIIKHGFIKVARKHIQAKYNNSYDDELKKIDIKTQLIMGIERGERIRQGAVMAASGAITPDEFRDLVGLDPLTKDQKEEIIRVFGPGRTGQFDRTTGDITSDYIRREDTHSNNPNTPQSRQKQQQT